jgi:hypothetical protein
MKPSEDKEGALLQRVDDVRAEHDRQAKVHARFDREHRIKCRDLILSGLPVLIEALEDPVGLADVDDVFINGLVDAPGYPEVLLSASESGPFTARMLLKALRLLHYHYLHFEPWPAKAYSAAFDWEGERGGPRLSTERQLDAVVSLIGLLNDFGVHVTSYDSNPGFLRLQSLTGRVFGAEMEVETLRKLVQKARRLLKPLPGSE